MKLISMLAVAGLLTSAAAFAQTTPAPAPAAAPTSTTTASPKHPSLKKCRKEAAEKGLKGADKKQFVKDCHAGK